jgi:hypothetical protein
MACDALLAAASEVVHQGLAYECAMACETCGATTRRSRTWPTRFDPVSLTIRWDDGDLDADVFVGQSWERQWEVRDDVELVDDPKAAFDRRVEGDNEVVQPGARATEGRQFRFQFWRHVRNDVRRGQHRQGGAEAMTGDH